MTSVEGKLPNPVARTIRKIATIRNKIVHEDGYELEDLTGFETDCEEVISFLSSPLRNRYSQVHKNVNEPPRTASFFGNVFVWGPITYYALSALVIAYTTYQAGLWCYNTWGLGAALVCGFFGLGFGAIISSPQALAIYAVCFALWLLYKMWSWKF